MGHLMTADEWRTFLSAGTRTGKLSTVSEDGGPHVAPVWFLVDGDDIVFNTGKGTVKGRNLAREGRAALCVDDERPPFSFAVVRGRVSLSEEPGQLREWATRIAERYMGAERAKEYGERNGVPGELLVRLRVEHVSAVADLAE
ncbi:PPOX class F420-dependent oxidoreductase [Streptomyces sp. G-5]|uniref:PPOX class F420-dependent oxidoreductase n=1 Tax=Streptomyces TaxID=1883 RepID=UPI0021CE7930|nr:PPOX class F420-dependent oxidoreductase [Streptomyces sp. G-5]MCU4749985.1 PPOX class F420-dependent oxidoreductase [Streptomyces sp. G-5]